MILHTDTRVPMPADVHRCVRTVLDLFLTHRWSCWRIAIVVEKIVCRSTCVNQKTSMLKFGSSNYLMIWNMEWYQSQLRIQGYLTSELGTWLTSCWLKTGILIVITSFPRCRDRRIQIFQPLILLFWRTGRHQKTPIPAVDCEAIRHRHFGISFFDYHAPERYLAVNFELKGRCGRPTCIDQHVRKLKENSCKNTFSEDCEIYWICMPNLIWARELFRHKVAALTKKNILCWYPFLESFCKHPSRMKTRNGCTRFSIPIKSRCSSRSFCRFSRRKNAPCKGSVILLISDNVAEREDKPVPYQWMSCKMEKSGNCDFYTAICYGKYVLVWRTAQQYQSKILRHFSA